MAEISNPTPAEVEACRREYGEAHDTQIAFGGECGWCGFYDPSVRPGYIADNGNVYNAAGELLEQHDFSQDL